MRTKECPSCAMEIDAKEKICPVCKYEFAQNMGISKWVAIALVILFLFYLIRSVF
jgi:hypothetical protein